MSNYHLARNPNTSAETLARLANDDDDSVRRGVAINPNTPPETLERLANDEKWSVRYYVTRNPNTPQYIRQYIKITEFLNYYE
jgi:hypothetical protein